MYPLSISYKDGEICVPFGEIKEALDKRENPDHPNDNQGSPLELYSGGRRIRTFEGSASRFTVCPLWPTRESLQACLLRF